MVEGSGFEPELGHAIDAAPNELTFMVVRLCFLRLRFSLVLPGGACELLLVASLLYTLAGFYTSETVRGS